MSHPPKVLPPWTWTEDDHLGQPDPAYRGEDLDSVHICPDLDGFDVVLIAEDGNDESLLEQAAAPVSVVLAALIRHYGRKVVVEWAQTLELDPPADPEQAKLFVEVESC